MAFVVVISYYLPCVVCMQVNLKFVLIEGLRAKRAYIAFLANFHFFAGSS